MAKKKETPKFTYLAKDVDRASIEGFMDGMGETHSVVYDAITSVINGLSEAWAIYNQGVVIDERKHQVRELELAINTLEHLRDVFQAKYDELLDEQKVFLRAQQSRELREELGL